MPAHTDQTVTPDRVEGAVEYDRLLERFGADVLTADHRQQFPGPPHRLLRRGVYYAQRDLDRFLEAATTGGDHSIVTGIGPSGPLHIGHVVPLYFAKHLQQRTGATVYIPLSDDEKYLHRELSLTDLSRYTRANLRDILAVGFDPEHTRIVIDTRDADVIYPIATVLAKSITQSTYDGIYGRPENVGQSFYPAVQATHLLLPQLVSGEHPTLVPIAIDQDPHVRLCRDVSGKQRVPVTKPGALLAKFLPSLDGPGKMSSSSDAPRILLTDDRPTIREKITAHAYSGGTR